MQANASTIVVTSATDRTCNPSCSQQTETRASRRYLPNQHLPTPWPAAATFFVTAASPDQFDQLDQHQPRSAARRMPFREKGDNCPLRPHNSPHRLLATRTTGARCAGAALWCMVSPTHPHTHPNHPHPSPNLMNRRRGGPEGGGVGRGGEEREKGQKARR